MSLFASGPLSQPARRHNNTKSNCSRCESSVEHSRNKLKFGHFLFILSVTIAAFLIELLRNTPNRSGVLLLLISGNKKKRIKNRKRHIMDLATQALASVESTRNKKEKTTAADIKAEGWSFVCNGVRTTRFVVIVGPAVLSLCATLVRKQLRRTWTYLKLALSLLHTSMLRCCVLRWKCVRQEKIHRADGTQTRSEFAQQG